MGWINSVDVIQNFIRRFVFDVCGVPANLEVRKDRGFPASSAGVVCMDGFDLITRLKIVRVIWLALMSNSVSMAKGGQRN